MIFVNIVNAVLHVKQKRKGEEGGVKMSELYDRRMKIGHEYLPGSLFFIRQLQNHFL